MGAGYAAVMLAACSWGTWRFILLAAEQRAPGLDARVESAVVMLVITLFAFAVLPFEKRGGERPARSARDWLGVAWLGVADAMNVFLLFAAYAQTSVAIAVTTHYLAPILVATLAPIALRERAQQGTWLAATGGLIGLAMLLRPWSGELTSSDLVGAAAGAGSAFFYASNVLVNKRLVTKFTPIELMAFHGVVATPLLFALAPMAAFAKLTIPATLVLVGGGIGPGALGGMLFIWALRRARAADASTLTLLEPLVAVGIAVIARNEHLAPTSWLGASTILACAAMIMRRAA
jgi:drug/metabolite transporter (DMT)-like permease